jgi:hypothetical protein
MREHMSRPSHAPHPSPQRSVAGNVECVAHEMQAPRKPTRAGVGRSPSRPNRTTTASGFRQRRAAVAEQCLAVDACVHALVCLCACAFAFVLRARMCLRGSVWMRLCARARVSVSSGVCECVHACHPMPHEPANPHAKRTTAAALLRWPSAPTAASPHGICRGAHRSMGHRTLPCTPAAAPSHHGSYPMSWPHTFSSHASYAPLAPIARYSSAT